MFENLQSIPVYKPSKFPKSNRLTIIWILISVLTIILIPIWFAPVETQSIKNNHHAGCSFEHSSVESVKDSEVDMDLTVIWSNYDFQINGSREESTVSISMINETHRTSLCKYDKMIHNVYGDSITMSVSLRDTYVDQQLISANAGYSQCGNGTCDIVIIGLENGEYITFSWEIINFTFEQLIMYAKEKVLKRTTFYCIFVPDYPFLNMISSLGTILLYEFNAYVMLLLLFSKRYDREDIILRNKSSELI